MVTEVLLPSYSILRLLSSVAAYEFEASAIYSWSFAAEKEFTAEPQTWFAVSDSLVFVNLASSFHCCSLSRSFSFTVEHMLL